MRRTLVLAAAVGLGLLASLPPVAAEDYGAPPVAGGDAGSPQAGFFGFQQLATEAQGQVATGYFFAVGDEENRLVGAHSEIDGPPVNSRMVAAFVQRGIGATYVYGVAGGPGGTSGALPDPPPGEAPAYYPTDPHESSFSGPLTAVVNGGQARTIDGRFHSRAGEGADGVAESAVTQMDVPGYFDVDQAVVTSHGQPVAAGVEAESVSVLRGLTVGPLHLDSLTSRAYGFIPSSPGDPKGVATTIVEGATVGKTPVLVTDHGIVVADKNDPSAEQQIRTALTQAGLSDVRLLDSLTAPSENNQQVRAQAGGLQVIHKDPKFGAQNPQGFQGGGFALGGAEVSVTGQRCEPACAAPPESSAAPGLSFTSPGPADSGSEAAAGPPGPVPTGTSFEMAASPGESAASADTGLATDTGLTDTGFGVAAGGPTSTFTRDVTPEPAAGPPVRRLVPARRPATARSPLQAALAAANGMGGGEARDVRGIFLALGGAVIVLVMVRGLAKAR